MQKRLCLEGMSELNLRGEQGNTVMEGRGQHWLCWEGEAVPIAETQAQICPIKVSNSSEKWEESKRPAKSTWGDAAPLWKHFFALGGVLQQGMQGKGLVGWWSHELAASQL